MKVLWKLRNALAEMCDPIEGLCEDRVNYEKQRLSIVNGTYVPSFEGQDVEEVLDDTVATLAVIDEELARRQRSA